MKPSFGRQSVFLLLNLFLAGTVAHGGMQEVLEAVRESEFRFARSVSDVPFLPLGWVQDTYYPNAGFEPKRGNLPNVTIAQNTFSAGAVYPVDVRKREMVLVGGDLTMDFVGVKTGPFRDQRVLRLTPVAAWLKQASRDDLVGVFVAPMISKELKSGGPWGFSGYGGIVAMHYFSDTLQFLYGGVYHNNFGQHAAYPYLGVNWIPNSKWSVALVFPWPTIVYAPDKNWILQLGLAPGGGSWVRRRDSYEITEYLGSWNLQAGIGYRLYSHFWLVASGGMAGLRGWELGDSDALRYESKPSAVFALALQFRP
ncbi:MAG: DUF6268 family outer membrane beta-barrel protein [Puniceicoccaceae bacterium]